MNHLAAIADACATRHPLVLLAGWDEECARLLADHRRGPQERRWLPGEDVRERAAADLARLGPQAGTILDGGWEAAWRTWGRAWSCALLDRHRPGPVPPPPDRLGACPGAVDPLLACGRSDDGALLACGRWLRWRGRAARCWADPGPAPGPGAPLPPGRAGASWRHLDPAWEPVRRIAALAGRSAAPPGPAADLLESECLAWTRHPARRPPCCDEPWEAALALGALLPWLDLAAVADLAAVLRLGWGELAELSLHLRARLPGGLRADAGHPDAGAPANVRAVAALHRLTHGGGLGDAVEAAALPCAAPLIASQIPRLGPEAAGRLAGVLPACDAVAAIMAAGLDLDPAGLGPAWMEAIGPATALALAGRRLDDDPGGVLALAVAIPPLDPCRDQALMLATAALLRLGRPAEAAERAMGIADRRRRSGALTQARLAAGDAAGAAGALDGVADQEVFLRLGAGIAERLVHSQDRASLGTIASLAARRRREDPRIDRFADTLAALAAHLGPRP